MHGGPLNTNNYTGRQILQITAKITAEYLSYLSVSVDFCETIF